MSVRLVQTLVIALFPGKKGGRCGIVLTYPRKPKFDVVKFARFGKMLGKSAPLTPNHVASVAAY